MSFEKASLERPTIRTLSQDVVEDTPGIVTPAQRYDTSLAELVSRYADLSLKSQDIDNLITSLSADLRIPVPQDSVHVRTAIARLEPTHPQDYISFGLYRQALQGLTDSILGVDITRLSGRIIGDRITDGNRWSHIVSSQSSTDALGEVPGVFGSIALHLFLLFALQQVLNVPAAPDKATDTLTPNSGSILGKAALGVLVLSLIHAGEGSIDGFAGLKDMADRMGFGSLVDSLSGIDGNAQEFDPSQIFTHNVPGMTNTDSALVVEHADGWISESNDPSFAGWSLHRANQRTRNFANNASTITDNAVARRTMGFGNLSTIPKIPDALIGMMLCESVDSAARLDAIAGILTTGYTKDLLCCMTRIMGKIHNRFGESNASIKGSLDKGASFLNRMAYVLEVLSVFRRRSVDDVLFDLYEQLRKKITIQVLSLLQSGIDAASASVESLFSEMMSDEDMAIFARCFGVVDAFDLFFLGLDELSGYFQDLVLFLSDGLIIDRMKQSDDLEYKQLRQWANIIAKLLRAIAGNIDASMICISDDVPTIREADRLLSDLSLPDPVSLASHLPTGDNRYRHFGPSRVTLPGLDRPAPTGLRAVAPTDPSGECLQRASNRELSQAFSRPNRVDASRNRDDARALASGLERLLA